MEIYILVFYFIKIILFNFEGLFLVFRYLMWELSGKAKILLGGVAQLGEHLPCTQGVRSSILLISTIRVEVRETPVKWAYSSVG